jgi:putative transcriptional regulator
LFEVIKTKAKEKIRPVEVNEYVEKNKLPASTEYVVRNRIKEHREKLGLTQANVAEMLNITRQSFSLIETEKQTPSILTSWLISKVLNADIGKLFYFEEIEGDKNG